MFMCNIIPGSVYIQMYVLRKFPNEELHMLPFFVCPYLFLIICWILLLLSF